MGKQAFSFLQEEELNEDFYWEWPGWARLEASKSEEQLRLSGLELKRGKAVMARTCAEEG